MNKNTIVEKWIMHTPRGDFEFEYTLGTTPTVTENKPIWVKDFKRSWDNPSIPPLFEFTLADDTYIQDAMNFLYNGPANDIKYPGVE